jgi:hypothetical protein
VKKGFTVISGDQSAKRYKNQNPLHPRFFGPIGIRRDRGSRMTPPKTKKQLYGPFCSTASGQFSVNTLPDGVWINRALITDS